MNESQGISVVLDESRHAFHVTCAPGYNSRQLGRVLDDLEAQGYELLDSDEEPKEILEGDRIRIWLRRIICSGLAAACLLFGINTVRANGDDTDPNRNLMAAGSVVVGKKKSTTAPGSGSITKAGHPSDGVKAPRVSRSAQRHDDVLVSALPHAAPPRTDRQPVEHPAKRSSLLRKAELPPVPSSSNVRGGKESSDGRVAGQRLKPILGLSEDLLQLPGHPVELLVGEVVLDPPLL